LRQNSVVQKLGKKVFSEHQLMVVAEMDYRYVWRISFVRVASGHLGLADWLLGR
jgi:hypothetical protein